MNLLRWPARNTLIGVLLFGAALVPRVVGLGSSPIQPDELHWEERARTIVEKVAAHDYVNATSHLGQPGIPAALLMAGGQYAGRKLNAIFDQSPGMPRYIDPLAASRMPLAIVSSLLPVVLFLACAPVMGLAIAALAALMIAWDPIFVGMGRLAHLDSLLTLFVTCAVMLYYHGVRLRKILLRFAAGLFWGLSVAIKPTAAAVVPAFILYRIGRAWCRRHTGAPEPWFCWSDLWSVVAGQVLFCLLYTRLWHYPSEYLWRKQIGSKLADLLYATGSALHRSWLLVLLYVLLATLVAFTVRMVRRPGFSPNLRYHLLQTAILGLFVCASLATFPQVYDNLVRFWYWVAGLSNMKHFAYGRVTHPPVGGYPMLFFSRLPSLDVLGAIVGILLLLIGILRRRKRTPEIVERDSLLVLFVVLFLIWGFLLQSSPKQAFRYLWPAVPGILVIAAGAWVWVARFVGRRSTWVSRVSIAIVTLILSAALCRDLTASYPDHLLFYSRVSGGMKAAVERKSTLAFAGIDQAVQYLQQSVDANRRKTRVAVFGDGALFSYVYHRNVPEREQRLEVRYNVLPTPGSFVVVFGSELHEAPPKLLAQYAGSEQDFAYVLDGVPLIKVFRVPIPDYNSPVAVDLADAPKPVGREDTRSVEVDGVQTQTTFVYAEPGKGRAGYLFSGVPVVANPGEYRFSVLACGFDLSQERPDDNPVLTFEVGKRCRRTVIRSELSEKKMNKISFNCTFDKLVDTTLRAYWYGTVGIGVKSAEIQKLSR